MKRNVLFFLSAVLVFASGADGIKPRPAASDYPVKDQAGNVTIAAAVLDPDQVKSLFSTDLKDYVVVEVGVYPAAGNNVNVTPDDFAIRIGTDEVVRAANPGAIAAAKVRKNAPSRQSRRSDIDIYPTADIGYESGGGGYDPVTGRRRGGMYGGGGVGVGVGGSRYPDYPAPASTGPDREVMQQELADKTLPAGPTDQPVAGYLYFRLPPKSQNSALELQYYAKSGKVRLPLPAVKH